MSFITRKFRTTKPATDARTANQRMLDQLRFDNPSNAALQLHCDRMQAVVNGTKW